VGFILQKTSLNTWLLGLHSSCMETRKKSYISHIVQVFHFFIEYRRRTHFPLEMAMTGWQPVDQAWCPAIMLVLFITSSSEHKSLKIMLTILVFWYKNRNYKNFLPMSPYIYLTNIKSNTNKTNNRFLKIKKIQGKNTKHSQK